MTKNVLADLPNFSHFDFGCSSCYFQHSEYVELNRTADYTVLLAVLLSKTLSVHIFFMFMPPPLPTFIAIISEVTGYNYFISYLQIP